VGVGVGVGVGVSGWDLSEAPEGLILSLARELEQSWLALGGNLRDAPCAPELKSVDATAPDGDPVKTRIRIENLCLQTDAFRKMHLEVAWGLGGIEVLHCVMYPWPNSPLPIFAADLVAFGGRVTLCIADTSPTRLDLSLLPAYVAAADALRAQMLQRCPAIQPRSLPEWGEAILSPQVCVCVGPPREDEAQEQAEAFCEYARGLHAAHLRLAAEAGGGVAGAAAAGAVAGAAAGGQGYSSVDFGGGGEAGPSGSGGSDGGPQERLAAQVRFCEKQLLNDKTRRVLEKSMGAELTERYMTEVLFDVTPLTPLGPS